MNDEDKLFLQNPLKAIWIKLKEVEATVNKLNDSVSNYDDDSFNLDNIDGLDD